MRLLLTLQQLQKNKKNHCFEFLHMYFWANKFCWVCLWFYCLKVLLPKGDFKWSCLRTTPHWLHLYFWANKVCCTITKLMEAQKTNGLEATLFYQSQVSILGPVGYGPTTLPLRHSDLVIYNYYKFILIRFSIFASINYSGLKSRRSFCELEDP